MPAARRPRRAWSGPWVLLGLLVMAPGCSGGAVTAPTPPSPRPTTASQSAPTADGAETPDDAALRALDGVLARRAAALVDGDLQAFEATVADPGSPAGLRQLRAFRSALALRVARAAHEPASARLGSGRVEALLRYRIEGVDRADRTAVVRYDVVRRGAGWAVAAEDPTGPDAAPPWLAMPALAVRRSDHAVVAGTVRASALAAAAATVDRSLPSLARAWSGTPPRTLVLLPMTPEETRDLRGSAAPAVGEVAASTDGPLDVTGLATGDRVVLDPAAAQRLTPAGREVVLTHELAHVVVRASVPGAAPPWLAEGYADHEGYARAPLPHAELVAPLAAAVRAGRAPTELPTAEGLDPSEGDIEVSYLAAWQAAELVVDLRGEPGLRRLVRACSDLGGPESAERSCTAALPRVLGTDRAGLTRLWRERLAALAE